MCPIPNILSQHQASISTKTHSPRRPAYSLIRWYGTTSSDYGISWSKASMNPSMRSTGNPLRSIQHISSAIDYIKRLLKFRVSPPGLSKTTGNQLTYSLWWGRSILLNITNISLGMADVLSLLGTDEEEEPTATPEITVGSEGRQTLRPNYQL